jgi:uncharacterized membrane protein (UPF0127 family)
MPIALLSLIVATWAVAQPLSASYPLEIGSQVVRAEIAASPATRSIGLMHRRSLGEDEGMLFVFEGPRRLSFWMRNTYVALDIGYFDSAGVLREIHELEPLDERPVISNNDDLLYALEVKRGWFERHAVVPGDSLSLPSLEYALAELRRDGASTIR